MHIWYMYVLCKWCVCQHCAILDPIRQSSHTHLDGNLHPLGFVEEFYRYPDAAHGRPRIPWYLVATRFHRPVRRQTPLGEAAQGGGRGKLSSLNSPMAVCLWPPHPKTTKNTKENTWPRPHLRPPSIPPIHPTPSRGTAPLTNHTLLCQVDTIYPAY
jgi:hypothetical protein